MRSPLATAWGATNPLGVRFLNVILEELVVVLPEERRSLAAARREPFPFDLPVNDGTAHIQKAMHDVLLDILVDAEIVLIVLGGRYIVQQLSEAKQERSPPVVGITPNPL